MQESEHPLIEDKAQPIAAAQYLKDDRSFSQMVMNIEIKDGIIVINNDVITDFEVYKQLYNLEIKKLIGEGGECSICFLKFQPDQTFPIVKSCIEYVIELDDTPVEPVESIEK